MATESSRLNANPPFLGTSFGRFTSANCNHIGLAGFYATSTGAPVIPMESMACTDGDFALLAAAPEPLDLAALLGAMQAGWKVVSLTRRGIFP
jgi:hypothetical protein